MKAVLKEFDSINKSKKDNFQSLNGNKCNKEIFNWAGLDSNQRSITQRIYNPPPLTTRTPTPF